MIVVYTTKMMIYWSSAVFGWLPGIFWDTSLHFNSVDYLIIKNKMFECKDFVLDEIYIVSVVRYFELWIGASYKTDRLDLKRVIIMMA